MCMGLWVLGKQQTFAAFCPCCYVVVRLTSAEWSEFETFHMRCQCHIQDIELLDFVHFMVGFLLLLSCLTTDSELLSGLVLTYALFGSHTIQLCPDDDDDDDDASNLS